MAKQRDDNQKTLSEYLQENKIPRFDTPLGPNVGRDLSARPVTPPKGAHRLDTYYGTLDRNVLIDQISKSQSSGAKIGNAVAQSLTTMVGDTISGFGYLAELVDGVDNLAENSHNLFVKLGEGITEYGQEKAPIYSSVRATEGFRPFDVNWIANGLPSLASTLSMLIPSTAVIRGISGLGKLARYGSKAAAKTAKAARRRKVIMKARELGMDPKDLYKTQEALRGLPEGVGGAIVSRHIENMMEATGTFETTYQEALEMGLSEEKAKMKAAQAAKENYKLGYMALMTDIPQYLAVFGFKFPKMKVPKSVALTKVKEYAGAFVGEGFEELFQFGIAEHTRKKALFGDDYQSSLAREVYEGLSDPEGLSAAVIGGFGGAFFKAVGDRMAKSIDDASKSDVMPAIMMSIRALQDDISEQVVRDAADEETVNGVYGPASAARDALDSDIPTDLPEQQKKEIVMQRAAENLINHKTKQLNDLKDGEKNPSAVDIASARAKLAILETMDQESNIVQFLTEKYTNVLNNFSEEEKKNEVKKSSKKAIENLSKAQLQQELLLEQMLTPETTSTNPQPGSTGGTGGSTGTGGGGTGSGTPPGSGAAGGTGTGQGGTGQGGTSEGPDFSDLETQQDKQFFGILHQKIKEGKFSDTQLRERRDVYTRELNAKRNNQPGDPYYRTYSEKVLEKSIALINEKLDSSSTGPVDNTNETTAKNSKALIAEIEKNLGKKLNISNVSAEQLADHLTQNKDTLYASYLDTHASTKGLSSREEAIKDIRDSYQKKSESQKVTTIKEVEKQIEEAKDFHDIYDLEAKLTKARKEVFEKKKRSEPNFLKDATLVELAKIGRKLQEKQAELYNNVSEVDPSGQKTAFEQNYEIAIKAAVKEYNKKTGLNIDPQNPSHEVLKAFFETRAGRNYLGAMEQHAKKEVMKDSPFSKKNAEEIKKMLLDAAEKKETAIEVGDYVTIIRDTPNWKVIEIYGSGNILVEKDGNQRKIDSASVKKQNGFIDEESTDPLPTDITPISNDDPTNSNEPSDLEGLDKDGGEIADFVQNKEVVVIRRHQDGRYFIGNASGELQQEIRANENEYNLDKIKPEDGWVPLRVVYKDVDGVKRQGETVMTDIDDGLVDYTKTRKMKLRPGISSIQFYIDPNGVFNNGFGSKGEDLRGKVTLGPDNFKVYVIVDGEIVGELKAYSDILGRNKQELLDLRMKLWQEYQGKQEAYKSEYSTVLRHFYRQRFKRRNPSSFKGNEKLYVVDGNGQLRDGSGKTITPGQEYTPGAVYKEVVFEGRKFFYRLFTRTFGKDNKTVVSVDTIEKLFPVFAEGVKSSEEGLLTDMTYYGLAEAILNLSLTNPEYFKNNVTELRKELKSIVTYPNKHSKNDAGEVTSWGPDFGENLAEIESLQVNGQFSADLYLKRMNGRPLNIDLRRLNQEDYNELVSDRIIDDLHSDVFLSHKLAIDLTKVRKNVGEETENLSDEERLRKKIRDKVAEIEKNKNFILPSQDGLSPSESGPFYLDPVEQIRFSRVSSRISKRKPNEKQQNALQKDLDTLAEELKKDESDPLVMLKIIGSIRRRLRNGASITNKKTVLRIKELERQLKQEGYEYDFMEEPSVISETSEGSNVFVNERGEQINVKIEKYKDSIELDLSQQDALERAIDKKGSAKKIYISLDGDTPRILQNEELKERGTVQVLEIPASEAENILFKQKKEIVESALTIGTKVDVLVRDFFQGVFNGITSAEQFEAKFSSEQEYPNYNVSNPQEVYAFIEQLRAIKNTMDARGEKVLANDIVVYDIESGIAGTIDLLTYDDKGVFRIYDMKTMRGDKIKSDKYNDSYKGNATDRQKHLEQLSLYRILLYNTHGVLAETVGILPIEVAYNAGDTTTSKLKILGGIQHTPLDNVGLASLNTPVAPKQKQEKKEEPKKPSGKKSSFSNPKFANTSTEELFKMIYEREASAFASDYNYEGEGEQNENLEEQSRLEENEIREEINSRVPSNVQGYLFEPMMGDDIRERIAYILGRVIRTEEGILFPDVESITQEEIDQFKKDVEKYKKEYFVEVESTPTEKENKKEEEKDVSRGQKKSSSKEELRKFSRNAKKSNETPSTEQTPPTEQKEKSSGVPKEKKKKINISRSEKIKKNYDERKKTRLHITGQKYDKATAEEVIEEARKILGNYSYEVVQNIIDNYGREAFGVFTGAAIQFAKDNAKGTGRHEAFHVIFDFLTLNQKNALYDEYRKKPGNKNLSKYDLEELMADDFMDYYDSDVAVGISAKIKKFFQYLADLIRVVLNRPMESKQLFRAMERGLYRNRVKPRFKKANLLKYRVPEQFTTSHELYRRVNDIIFDFFLFAEDVYAEYLREEYPDKSESEINELASDKIDAINFILQFGDDSDSRGLGKNSVYVEELVERLRYEIDNLQDNPTMDVGATSRLIAALEAGTIQPFLYRELVSYGITPSSRSAYLMFGVSEERLPDSLQEESNDREGWQTTVGQDSRKESLSVKLRVLLSHIKKRDKNGNIILNEVGIPEMYSRDEAFNTILERIGNSYSIENMLEKIRNIPIKDIRDTLLFYAEDLSSEIATNLWEAIGQSYNPDVKVAVAEKGKYSLKSADRFTLRNNILNSFIAVEKTIPFGDMKAMMSLTSSELLMQLHENGIMIPPEVVDLITGGKTEAAKNALNQIRLFDYNYSKSSKKLNNLVKAIEPFYPKSFQSAFYSVEGERVYSWIRASYIGKMISQINNGVITKASFRNNPFLKNSKILERNDIRFVLMDGVKHFGKKKGVPYSKMSPKELLLTQQLGWREGIFMTPVLSDSPNMVGVQFTTGRASFTSSHQNLINLAIKEIEQIEMFESYIAEIERRIQDKEDTLDLEGVPQMYTILKQMKSFNEKWNKQLFFPGATRENLPEYMTNLINTETSKMLAEYQKTGLITKDKNGNLSTIYSNARGAEEISKELRNQIINDMHFRIEFVALSVGNPSQYKNPEDFYKRAKQIWSPGTYLNLNRMDQKTYNVEYEESVIRKNGEDSENKSENYDVLKELLSKSSRKDEILALYEKVDVTDAQSYIDPFAHMQRLKGLGRDNFYTRKAYDLIMQGKSIYAMTPKELGLSAREYQKVKDATEKSFKVLKPFYYSKHKPSTSNKNVASNFNFEHGVQNKDSEFTMMPAYADIRNGFYNEKFKTRLERMGYTFSYVNKETGAEMSYDEAKSNPEKAEFVVKFDKAGRIRGEYTDKFTFDSALKVGMYGVGDGTRHQFNYADWRLQVETPPHHIDTFLKIGTQITKLFSADLEKKDKPYIDEYNQLMRSDIEEDSRKFRERFYDAEGNFKYKDFIELLREEVIERKLGEQYLDALEIDPSTGKTKLPLWFPMHAQRIESMIFSMYRKNITERKIEKNGATYVNVTSDGFSRKLKIKKVNGKTVYEVMVAPYNREFWKKEYLTNGYPDAKKIKEKNPELLEGLMYRIPTEGKYSMFSVEVVEFLPPHSGGGIVMPEEVTAIAGLDFDIDKVFGVFKSDATVSKQGNRAINKVRRKYRNRINKLKNEIDEIYAESMEYFEPINIANKSKAELAEEYVQIREERKNVKQVISNIEAEIIEYENALIDASQIETSAITEDNVHDIQQVINELNERLVDYEQYSKDLKNALKVIRADQKEIKESVPSSKESKKYLTKAQKRVLKLQEKIEKLEKRRKEELTPLQKAAAKRVESDNRKIDIIKTIIGTYDEQAFKAGSFDRMKATNRKIRFLEQSPVFKREAGKGENNEYTWKEFSALSEKQQDDILSAGDKLSFFLPSDQIRVANRMNVGKALVGVAAINNVAHSMIQKGDVQLASPLNFGGSVYSSLSKLYDKVGSLITENIAETLAAFVDNGKDPQAEYFNMNLFTADVGYLMLNLGIPLETVQLFLAQPILKEYTELYFNYGGDFAAKDSAYEEMLKRYPGLEQTLMSFNGEIPDGNSFTNQYLEENIKNQKGDAVVFALFDYLNNTYAPRFSDLVRAIKTADEGLNKDQFEAYKAIRRPIDFIESESSQAGPLLPGAIALFTNDHYMNDLYKIGMLDAYKEFTENLDYPNLVSGTFSNIINYVEQDLGKLNEDTLKLLFESYMRYLSSNSDLYKYEYLGNLAPMLKQLKKDYPDNAFLSRLYSKKVKTEERNLDSGTPVTSIVENRELKADQTRPEYTYPNTYNAIYNGGKTSIVRKKSSINNNQWNILSNLREGDIIEIPLASNNRNIKQKVKVTKVVYVKAGLSLNNESMERLSKKEGTTVEYLTEQGFRDPKEDYINIQFELVTDYKMFDLIEFSGTIGSDKGEIDRIRNSFLELFENEQTREDAIKLAKYAFARDGFSTSLGGFAAYVPIELFIDTKIGQDFLKSLEKNVLHNEFSMDEKAYFTELFIRNNINNISGIRTLRPEDGLDYDSEQNPLYRKKYEKAGESTKLVIYKGNGFTGKYEKISKLGIWGQNEKQLVADYPPMGSTYQIDNTNRPTIKRSSSVSTDGPSQAALIRSQEEARKQKELEELKKSLTNQSGISNTSDSQNLPPERRRIEDSTNNFNSKKSFTYNGVTIPTEFELSSDQVQALEQLIDFANEYFNNPDPNKPYGITLEGQAGTGKTTIIRYFQDYMMATKEKRYDFSYMAPTHAATIPITLSTIKGGHNKMALTTNKGIVRRDGRWAFEGLDGFGTRGIAVIDEASMFGGKRQIKGGGKVDNYVAVEQASRNDGVLVIFIGDQHQLPVVEQGATTKKASKAFTEFKKVSLTKVHRQKKNALLSLLQKMRESDRLQILLPKNPKEEVAYRENKQWQDELVADLEKKPLDTLVVSYTNKQVQKYNKLIRENVFNRRGNLQKGDLIVGYAGYNSKDVVKGHIANSVRYEVLGVMQNGSVVNIVAESREVKKIQESLGEGAIRNPATTMYYQLSDTDTLTFDFITNEHMEENNREISEQMNRLDAMYKIAKKSGTKFAWFKYFQVLSATETFFQMRNLGEDYIYNPNSNRMEKYNRYDPSPEHKAIKSRHNKLVVEKGIDYGHAVTVHKSQGATIENVYFDTKGLKGRTAVQVYANNKKFTEELQALAYVAMSRASKKLRVNNLGTSKLNTKLLTDEQIASDVQTEQPTEQPTPQYTAQQQNQGNVPIKEEPPKKELTEEQQKTNQKVFKLLTSNGDDKLSEWGVLDPEIKDMTIGEYIAMSNRSGLKPYDAYDNLVNCKGFGSKNKARDGLKTTFTKGGKWSVIKEFHGSSHEQGGIDITIDKNGVNLTNKDGKMKAKKGLVLPGIDKSEMEEESNNNRFSLYAEAGLTVPEGAIDPYSWVNPSKNEGITPAVKKPAEVPVETPEVNNPTEPTYDAGMMSEMEVKTEAPSWLKYKRDYEAQNPYTAQDLQADVDNRFANPVGREAIDKIDPESYRQDIKRNFMLKRDKEVTDYVRTNLVAEKEQEFYDKNGRKPSRPELMNMLTDKEHDIVYSDPSYQPSLWDDTLRGLQSLTEFRKKRRMTNILKSDKYSDREKQQMIDMYKDDPVMAKIDDALKIFSATEVPAKIVQAAFRDDYSMSDAVRGRKNDATMAEDIMGEVLNPINYIGGAAVKAGAKALGKTAKAAKAARAAGKVGDNIAKNTVFGLNEKSFIDIKTKVNDILEYTGQVMNKPFDNAYLAKTGNDYFKELGKPESVRRLKAFSDEYGIDLYDAYERVLSSWKKNKTSLGLKNKKLTVMTTKGVIKKKGRRSVQGFSTLTDKEIDAFKQIADKYGNPSKELASFFDTADRVNFVGAHAKKPRYTAWHELSHFVNANIMYKSRKLKKEIREMLVTPNEVSKIYQKNFNYISDPTETWAYLSTNLRMQLKDAGLIKNYLDEITVKTLNVKGIPVWDRFGRFVKDKEAFVKLYNKMTLVMAPLAAAAAVNANKESKNETEQ